MTELISRDELREAIDAQSVTVVDALGAEYHAKQHIPGAVAMAPGDVSEQASTLLPNLDAPIVTYCSNAACGNSSQVAETLAGLGYTNVRKYREGIQDWIEGGLPVDSL
jgi:rhodanese-related sulfurtransferase